MTELEVLQRGCSAGTTRAYNRLKEGVVGDMITREEMAAVIGFPCETGKRGYANVCTAIAKVLRECGIVWQWDRSQRAWRCLDPTERLSLARTFNSQAKRRLRRSTNVAETIDASKLDESKRSEHQLLVLQNSLGMCSLSRHLTKRLEDKQRARQQLAAPTLDKLAESLTAF